MKTHLNRRRRMLPDRAGTSTVEMALVAPVLFLIVFGLFEISFGYMVHHLIQDAARQGCRTGIRYKSTNAAVLSTVNALISAEHIQGATTTVLVNNAVADVSTAKVGDQITVKISVPASKVTFFPTTGYLKGTLSAMCTMRHD